MAIPSAPTNLIITPDYESNIVSWDDSLGATKYNIYFKKDKTPNCYFNDLNDWTQQTNNGTITLENGAVKLDITDGVDGVARIINKYPMLSGDFIIDIDMLQYVADDPGTINSLHIWLAIFSDDLDNRMYINYRHEVNHEAWIIHKINGSQTTESPVNIGVTPTKLRLTRVGNILYAYVYTGSWSFVDSQDFSSFASTLTEIRIDVLDSNNRGGYAVFDNLIITPSVKSSGTKLTDITSPYNHESLDVDHVYCYEVTAENIDGESNASLENFGIPIDYLLPPIINGIGDDSKNIITISESYGADSYNIYWSINPDVTKNNGIKIENVSPIYDHINLIKQNYYYIATFESVAEGEGPISNEICLKPDFEGKIFNHNEQIRESLLFQYKDKD